MSQYKRPTKREMMAGVSGILSSRPLEYATMEYTTEAGRFIRHHQTDIIAFVNNTIVLNNGGWFSKTTKDRFNRYLSSYGIGLWQEKSQWWIKDSKGTVSLYYNGMTFTTGGVLAGKPKGKDKKKLRLLKLIKKYVKKVRDMDELPLPDDGDCWYCLLKNEDGTPLGDLGPDTYHLESHLEQQDVHGSLLFNALEHAGYKNAGIVLLYDVKRKEIGRYNVPRAVEIYLKDKLGIPR